MGLSFETQGFNNQTNRIEEPCSVLTVKSYDNVLERAKPSASLRARPMASITAELPASTLADVESGTVATVV